MTVSTPASTRPCRRLGDRFGTATFVGRLFVLAGSTGVALVVLSVPASAHSGVGRPGGSVAFWAVIAVPVLAGFLGGVVVIRHLDTIAAAIEGHRTREPFDWMLVALSGTFIIAALASDVAIGIAGGGLGATIAMVSRGRDRRRWSKHGHAGELTLGGIYTHRVFEGVALATLYATGAAIGIAGTLVVAGHATLETVAIGGLYATRPLKAIGAIALVQTGYVAGAGGAVGLGVTVSVPLQTMALGFVGGVLIVVAADARGVVLLPWTERRSAENDQQHWEGH